MSISFPSLSDDGIFKGTDSVQDFRNDFNKTKPAEQQVNKRREYVKQKNGNL